MYVAVKGGERAIDNAHRWLEDERRGDRKVTDLSVDQIKTQLSLSIAKVMAEGSLFDPELASLAIKQARGDLIEAIFFNKSIPNNLTEIWSWAAYKYGQNDCQKKNISDV